jgi:hypothetical protein
VTGADVLTLAGTPRPTDEQSAWADMTAAAAHYLGTDTADPDAGVPDDTPGYAEVQPAAQLAAVELYKRREAPFGATSYADAYGQAIRLSRDYLGPILPTLRRWHPTAGVVAG